jgi:predicted AAA+ superfamily ATPase
MKNSITQTIGEQNPWWIDPSVPVGYPGPVRRDIFDTVKTRVTGRDLITAIIGLRRVGKTTLVKQVMHALAESGVERKKLLYFSCEHLEGKHAAELLENVIIYQVKKYPKEKVYLFFDEIQYIDGWNVVLKKYGDMYPTLKFTITGSASLFIATRARESLAGRIQEVIVYPMGYGEYLRINKHVSVPALRGWDDVGRMIPYQSVLEEYFQEYLAWGEFPYLDRLPTWDEKREYVVDFVIRKVLEMDLPRLKRFYGAELVRLMDILIAGSGGLVELKNLGIDIGLSHNTLREYLDTLENTHLISQVYNRGIGYRTRSVRQRKIYVGSVNAVVLKSGIPFSSAAWQMKAGPVVENFVFNYLKRTQPDEVFFWRERQVREVDFICRYQDTLLPVEVKYQQVTRSEDLKNVLLFCRREKLKRAVIVTKHDASERMVDGVRIQYIPAYFLLS